MKAWKTTFTAIFIAETLAIAGFATSMPVIPLYLGDLGVRDPAALKYWAGLIQSVAGITLAIFAPIWGGMADSIGKRLMLLRAMYGGAAIVALMAFATDPWQLLVLRGLQGCFTGTVAAATVLVAGLSPAASLGFALGMLQMGVSVGNSLGPLVGGVISDFLGHRAAFIATGLMLLAAGIIIHRNVDDDTVPRSERSAGSTILPELGPIFASPVLVALMAMTFAIQAANSIPAPMLPLFIQELIPDASLVGSATGIVLGAGAAASAVAAVLAGRLSAKWGYARILFVCLSGGALLSVPQAFARDPLELTLYRTVSMLFLGGALPGVNALIALHADKSRQGGIYGVTSSVAAIGMAIGPVIGSMVAAAFGFRAVFIAGAAMLAGTVIGGRLVAPRLAASGAAASNEPRA